MLKHDDYKVNDFSSGLDLKRMVPWYNYRGTKIYTILIPYPE